MYQEEICFEELGIENKLISKLQKLQGTNSEVRSVWGSTLYHRDDMPYNPATDLPHIYGRFRSTTEKVKVRELLNSPSKGDLPFTSDKTKDLVSAIKYMPTLDEFGFTDEEQDLVNQKDKRRNINFHGGESHGLKRADDYIEKAVRFYNDRRNNLKGLNFSSKISPWLANGSLSIRYVYHKMR